MLIKNITKRLSSVAMGLAIVGTVSANDISQFPEYDCLIEPWKRVDISFADPGLLSEVLVKRSDSVAAGQLLARLDSGLEQATLNLRDARAGMREEIQSASANYAFNQRNQKRLQDLYKKNAIPFHKLDEAETNLAVSEHRLQQAKDNNRLAVLEAEIAKEVLARREVKSPFDGVVVKRYKSVGEYVEEEPVLQLVQLDPLRVQVLLPVSVFGQITPGMTAKVLPEAPMNKQSLQAAVVFVDPVVDVASGTFGVELELENAGNRLPSGLKCGVRFLQ